MSWKLTDWADFDLFSDAHDWPSALWSHGSLFTLKQVLFHRNVWPLPFDAALRHQAIFHVSWSSSLETCGLSGPPLPVCWSELATRQACKIASSAQHAVALGTWSAGAHLPPPWAPAWCPLTAAGLMATKRDHPHEEIAHTSIPCAAPTAPATPVVEDEPSDNMPAAWQNAAKSTSTPPCVDWFLDTSHQWKTERRWDMQRCVCETWVRSGACAPGCSMGSIRTLRTAGNGAHQQKRRLEGELCCQPQTWHGWASESCECPTSCASARWRSRAWCTNGSTQRDSTPVPTTAGWRGSCVACAWGTRSPPSASHEQQRANTQRLYITLSWMMGTNGVSADRTVNIDETSCHFLPVHQIGWSRRGVKHSQLQANTKEATTFTLGRHAGANHARGQDRPPSCLNSLGESTLATSRQRMALQRRPRSCNSCPVWTTCWTQPLSLTSCCDSSHHEARRIS